MKRNASLCLCAGLLSLLLLYACQKEEYTHEKKTVKADFSYSGAGYVAPAQITFENLSTNATSYLWNFGDSTTSIEVHPVHTYSMAGNFSVGLTAYAPDSTFDYMEKNITISSDEDGSYGTPFQNVPETKDIIMYEINLRAFSNTGDIQGIIERLNEIKELNINVIWLMPIHPIGAINSVNSPYSVKNYKEVNPEFGDLEDLRQLVEEAHERDMAVILDWVANHTAWDNPWIENTSWYTQDENGNIIHPQGTNWLDVADLNYENPEMRLAMIEAMKYWIWQANIDGFRCDAADFVPFDFWDQALDSLQNLKDRDLILLAEGTRRDHYSAGFQITFSFDFYGTLKNVFTNGASANSIIITHNNEYSVLSSGRHKLRYTTNHDESAWDATPMILYNGKDGALAASVVATCLGGVPMIYASQEVGVVDNVPFFENSTIDWSANPDMLEEYKNLLSFYDTSEIVKNGSLHSFEHVNVVYFKKILDEKELLIFVNTRNYVSILNLDEALENSTWINVLDSSEMTLPGSLILNAYEYLILSN